jgi:hypothetical protein
MTETKQPDDATEDPEDVIEEPEDVIEDSEPSKNTFQVGQFFYDLHLEFQEARDRLGVPAGAVGAFLGTYSGITTEDVVSEYDGSMIVVYHNKKIGKRPLVYLRSILRDDLGMSITIYGDEPRPRLGGGRRHPWQRKALFRTLIRVYSEEEAIEEDPELEDDEIPPKEESEEEDISV